MTFSESLTELETAIDGFNFTDRDGDHIPAPIITALIAKHNQTRWESAASMVARQEITPAEYLKEMLAMLETWMRKRFVSNLFSKFAEMNQ